jgi:hypothetical protein
MYMLSVKFLAVFLAFSVMPLAAMAQQPMELGAVVDKIVEQERAETQFLRQYSPLVETYIQYIRADQHFGEVPDGDRYFLGRASLAKGLELEPLKRAAGMKQKMFGGWGNYLMEFAPAGFLQMIYLDTNGFDPQHYKFEYEGLEFLGKVRCMVFDVEPLPKGKRHLGTVLQRTEWTPIEVLSPHAG